MHVYSLTRRAPLSREPTPQQRKLRAKWDKLEPCPYGCGGKLFGNVCSNDCPPMRNTRTCADVFADYSGLSEAS